MRGDCDSPSDEFEGTSMIVAGVLGMLFIFFCCGFFENWLIKECTNCHKKGSTSAVCWMYEVFAPGPGLQKFKLGCIHSHFLCSACMDLCLDEHFRIMFPRKDIKP